MRPSWLLMLPLLAVGCNAQLAGVAASAGLSIRAEAQLPIAVPLTGSAVVEFFGVPLQGTQDVVFVLDQSGSMDETAPDALAHLGASSGSSVPPRKIDAAQHELIAALERLPDGTRLNVVFFNDELHAFAPAVVPLDASVRVGLSHFVKTAEPSGRTALAPAMRTALLMDARHVVLLSDGLGNIGGGSETVLRDAREAMRGHLRIDTIGLGRDQDDELLQALASESGGLYQRL